MIDYDDSSEGILVHGGLGFGTIFTDEWSIHNELTQEKEEEIKWLN